MTSNPIFRGAATALITPLNESGIDFSAFARLIDWQIAEGVAALVIAGTTGEGSTLTDEEHRAAVRFAVEHTAGRVPVIAGTGSNDTAYAVDLTKYCCEVGADAMLVVTPYYNKATQNGLIKMYTTIADASTKPLILYNVPSRTGVNIQPKTCAALADHPNIAAIKEASGNIAEYALTRSMCGDDLVFWSGNDSDTVPMMALGAVGVISVASNIIPKDVAKLCELCLAGDFKAASAEYFRLADFFDKLFIETNPIPVKTAMNVAGMNVGRLRLPLVDMDPANLEKLKVSMRGVGLNV